MSHLRKSRKRKIQNNNIAMNDFGYYEPIISVKTPVSNRGGRQPEIESRAVFAPALYVPILSEKSLLCMSPFRIFYRI